MIVMLGAKPRSACKFVKYNRLFKKHQHLSECEVYYIHHITYYNVHLHILAT